jgi:formylglycine-generating enzyme required for sulfatase activity
MDEAKLERLLKKPVRDHEEGSRGSDRLRAVLQPPGRGPRALSDQALRELERACVVAPDDKLALERLQDERVRRGLGWHGEEMPPGVCVDVRAGRGVYAFALEPKGTKGGPIGDGPQLVYVPAGEVECDQCRGREVLRVGGVERMVCPDCNGTGKRKISPFYLGRFPVTWSEYLAFCGATRYTAPLGPSGHGLDIGGVIAAQWGRPDVHLDLRAPRMKHHPATHISLDDARAFCSWAGLRLPSEGEWKWAALGAPVVTRERATPEDEKRLPGLREFCGPASEIVSTTYRRYPWGNEPPSPERCVWAGGYHGLESDDYGRPTGTAPVVAWLCPSSSPGAFVRPRPGVCVADSFEAPAGAHTDRCRLVPARPLGASWCGAHDMAGNVWEWTSDGQLRGGSFRSPDHLLARDVQHWDHAGDTVPAGPQHDIGFRVALSAS